MIDAVEWPSDDRLRTAVSRPLDERRPGRQADRSRWRSAVKEAEQKD
jgi:hypothetical protein